MESEDIVIKNSVFDKIGVETFTEERLSSLDDVAFDLAINLKARCSGKSEELCAFKMPDDIFMHISELATMALVNDKYDLLVTVLVKNCRILRILHSIRYFLNCRNNQMNAFIRKLLYEYIGTVSNVNTS